MDDDSLSRKRNELVNRFKKFVQFKQIENNVYFDECIGKTKLELRSITKKLK